MFTLIITLSAAVSEQHIEHQDIPEHEIYSTCIFTHLCVLNTRKNCRAQHKTSSHITDPWRVATRGRGIPHAKEGNLTNDCLFIQEGRRTTGTVFYDGVGEEDEKLPLLATPEMPVS